MKRFWEIDLLRGLAVLGMIIFHIFFMLDFYGIFQQELYEGLWNILARFVQFIFTTLVGVSLVLSRGKREKSDFIKRQTKRGFFVVFCALIVSLGTYLFIGESYVRFGILHFIGLGILLGQFFVDFRYFNLILAVLSFWLGYILPGIQTDFAPFYILGLDYGNFSTIDYFPLFPWSGFIFLGISFGHFWLKRERRLEFKVPSFILFLGQNSLLIYLIHVPIILGIILAVQSILTA